METKIPKWLKDLQDNSWEIEILISGGAIFSLIQFSDFFMSWVSTLRMTNNLPGMVPFEIIGIFSIQILIIGFILHLLLRSFWLALLCVNFVYPQGIDKDKIRYKKPFKINNDLFDLESQIMKLDKYCASIMYLSIVSFISIVGLVFTFFMTFLLGILLNYVIGGDIVDYIMILFFVMLISYVVDFMTYGLLRKIPYLSYLIYPFFILFDIVSLRSFFQKSLWMLNTNINKLKFSVGMLLFLIAGITLTYFTVYKKLHWPNIVDSREYRWDGSSSSNDLYMQDNLYMDTWTEETISNVGISSKSQAGSLMEVYVGYKARYDDLIEMTSKIDSLRRFDKIISIEIDDSLYQNMEWVFTRKLNESLFGITTMLPINNLDNGLHKIKIYTKYSTFTMKELEAHGRRYELEFDIPFWVDR